MAIGDDAAEFTPVVPGRAEKWEEGQHDETSGTPMAHGGRSRASLSTPRKRASTGSSVQAPARASVAHVTSQASMSEMEVQPEPISASSGWNSITGNITEASPQPPTLA
jgi:hypothetical protein